jgi:hypothetical protein
MASRFPFAPATPYTAPPGYAWPWETRGLHATGESFYAIKFSAHIAHAHLWHTVELFECRGQAVVPLGPLRVQLHALLRIRESRFGIVL